MCVDAQITREEWNTSKELLQSKPSLSTPSPPLPPPHTHTRLPPPSIHCELFSRLLAEKKWQSWGFGSRTVQGCVIAASRVSPENITSCWIQRFLVWKKSGSYVDFENIFLNWKLWHLHIPPFNLILSVCLFQLFCSPPSPNPAPWERDSIDSWWYQASQVTCFILQHWLAASQVQGIFWWPAFQIYISGLHQQESF